LKPTAQLMLDYVIRTSPILAHLLPNPEDGEDSAASNPLQMSPISHENVHPNFIKKYSAKKVSSHSCTLYFALQSQLLTITLICFRQFFKASASLKKWAEEIYAPTERRNPATGKIVVTPVSFEL